MNEKYTELIKDIARVIAESERENFLLRHELERVQAQLEKSEAHIEQLVADQALRMMVKEEKRNA